MTMIRAARPWGGELSDVTLINEGTPNARIESIRPHDPAISSPGVIEGRGRILIPSFTDAHVHLDSTRLGLPFRPHTGVPGVWGMMLNDRNNWRSAEVSITERVNTTLATMIARGTTQVRTFAQVDADCRLERFDAVMAAKEAFRDQADMTVIAFPQAGLLLEDGSAEVLEEALRNGADVVGGIDPCELDRDPIRHLDIVFGLAEKYSVPIDFHLHEPGHLGVFTFELIADRIGALGMQGMVTMSHSYDLGSVDEATTARVVERFAELDIAWATVAPVSVPQLPLRRMVDAGVRVGLGEDGQRDYWGPYGNGDMLDRTWQLAFTHRFRKDEDIEMCLAVATVGGRAVLDNSLPRLQGVMDRPGLEPGAAAELVLVEGDTPTAAVMDRLPDRTVLHRGRVVADGLDLS